MQVDLDNEVRIRKERILMLKREIQQIEDLRKMLTGASDATPPDGDAAEKQDE